jgi:DNA sulfur modification protein DndC
VRLAGADEQPIFSGEDRALLDTICDRYEVPSKLVAKLLDVERQLNGMSRRSSIHQRISTVIDEDWRSEEDVMLQKAEPGS